MNALAHRRVGACMAWHVPGMACQVIMVCAVGKLGLTAVRPSSGILVATWELCHALGT